MAFKPNPVPALIEVPFLVIDGWKEKGEVIKARYDQRPDEKSTIWPPQHINSEYWPVGRPSDEYCLFMFDQLTEGKYAVEFLIAGEDPVRREFEYKAKSKPGVEAQKEVSITFPGPNGVVTGANFTVYGSSTHSLVQRTCQVGNNTYTGTIVRDAGVDPWIVTFSGVAAGSGLVTITNSKPDATSRTYTVV